MAYQRWRAAAHNAKSGKRAHRIARLLYRIRRRRNAASSSSPEMKLHRALHHSAAHACITQHIGALNGVSNKRKRRMA